MWYYQKQIENGSVIVDVNTAQNNTDSVCYSLIKTWHTQRDVVHVIYDDFTNN